MEILNKQIRHPKWVPYVKEALQHLLENGPLEGFAHDGICLNVRIYVERKYKTTPPPGACANTVCVFAQDWEHHTGHYAWPVPLINDRNPWSGRNLEMRQSLIRHVLNKIESFLAEKPTWIITKLSLTL